MKKELNIELSALEASIILEGLDLKARADGMESEASSLVRARLRRALLLRMKQREDAKFPQKESAV